MTLPTITSPECQRDAEYFERICVCNDWKTPTECASHVLVAMDGAASEAVRGLKAEQDTDLALIWETLTHRFAFVDEPQRAMRHFDVRKQLDGETLAVFEHGLRTLHGEAWTGVDLKSPDADSRLRRKFVDGLMDGQIQTYLRLHATSDDFPTTVAKTRQYEDVDKLCRTAKMPAIRTASVSDYQDDMTYQDMVDGLREVFAEACPHRIAKVNTAQASNSNAKNKKEAGPRQGSPAPSNTSAGSSSSRASSNGRTVRFQDQVDTRSGNQASDSWDPSTSTPIIGQRTVNRT